MFSWLTSEAVGCAACAVAAGRADNCLAVNEVGMCGAVSPYQGGGGQCPDCY